MPNALRDEASPYLRQHADNPVDWVPWNEMAFATAQERQVPVLVSIGYSTCHWCHVMAHECFEDAETARLMNELFVCIKVDREEHPEVDEIYMDAVQAMIGHGGWPLNAFVDHQGRPFYTCTYVPRHQWQQMLKQLSATWKSQPDRVATIAQQVIEHLRQEPTSGAMPNDIWRRLDQQTQRAFDRNDPGYGQGAERAPKFPPSQLLPLLLASGNKTWIGEAEAVLETMQDAGIHDRVGGGFHRYSVDAHWRLPHFEKMLYDNAQLMGAYARAGVQLGRKDFLRTAVNTADYLLRDMRIANGEGRLIGFAAAEDADDPGGEGSFYAWSPEQLQETLTAQYGDRIAAEWDIRPGKREIGRSGHDEPVLTHIPHPRGADLEKFAPNGDIQALRAGWEQYYPILREKRAKRPRPGRDDKALTDLNGLALEGFAALGRYADGADRPRFIVASKELARVLLTRFTANGLIRLPGHGQRQPRPAYITDYGHLVSGFTAAFNLIGDPELIDAAGAIANEAIERLRGDDGGFFTTPAGRSDLVRRSREFTDNAYPSGQNSLAVGLMRLWNFTGQGRWKAIAEGIFSACASIASQAPSAITTLLQAWLHRQRGQLTAVVAGELDDAKTAELLVACRRSTIAHLGIVPISSCRDRNWECLEGRKDLSEPQVLICTGKTCLAPARTVSEVTERLAQVEAGFAKLV